MTRAPRTPDLQAQKEGMRKLAALAGKWSGEAFILRAKGQFVDLYQTEEAEFKLDGLVLTIEGVGRTKAEGKLVLQALGLISFDDESGTYMMRAFNDGRWLETELNVADDGRRIVWGFDFGEIKTQTELRINEKGEWTEHAELIIGAAPPQLLMDLTVRRVSARH